MEMLLPESDSLTSLQVKITLHKQSKKKELCYQRLKPEFLIKKINNNLSNESNSK